MASTMQASHVYASASKGMAFWKQCKRDDALLGLPHLEDVLHPGAQSLSQNGGKDMDIHLLL